MKYSYILICLLLYSTLSLGQAAKDPAFLPPFNFRVDSTTLLATWEAPKLVLLEEDFEGDAFPPEGWSDTTLGMGWQCEDDPQFHTWWIVPEHTGRMALVNDDIAPYYNDGSMDFLYTPELEVTVGYGHPLPFLETWGSGSFETNFWSTDSENWSVTDMNGNLPPCAKFSCVPFQTNYVTSLESYPFVADTITLGQLYLDFDLKLNDNSQSGTEQLSVQVWNWDSQVWNTVKTYSNAEGTFGWMAEHIDITQYALASLFKIRFQASGENSAQVTDWLIDNIYIYNTCDPPTDLSVYPDNDGLHVEWDRPAGPMATEWMEWDDGVFSGTSIGTNDTVEFDCAHRWEPVQMDGWEGASIKEIAFVPAEAACVYNVRVWIGAGAANLVADQEVDSPVIGQWNYVTLASPVPIDITQELYIGYHVNTTTGHPAGCDDGPAIDGYGNMMNFGGWQTLLQINPALDYNWNISALVATNHGYSINYAIFRSDNNAPYSLIKHTTEEEYLDDSICLTGQSIIMMYKVQAIYYNEQDTCTSDFSNTDGYLCYPFVDELEEAVIRIYPNPASDVLYIESPEVVISIGVFDNLGCKVLRFYGYRADKIEVSVAGLPPGLYLVRVETASGISAAKVVVN